MDIKAPVVIIRINGQDLNAEWMRRVRSIKLTEVERKADTGTIELRDGDYTIQDSKVFRKGAVFSVLMGWNDELELKGPYIVKTYKPTYPDNGEPTLTIEFQDRSHAMNQQQRQRRFVRMTPKQIVERIAEENNLDADADDVDDVEFTDSFPLLQANITDARLMQTLSERYGYVWGISGNTLYFRPPIDLESVRQQRQVRVLSYRMNDFSLKSFAPEVKNSSGRRRNASGNRSGNVDIMNSDDENNGLFSSGANRDRLREISPALAELTRILPGQEADDSEPQSSSVDRTDTQEDPNDQRLSRRLLRSVNDISQQFGRLISLGEPENEESEPGDESGAATPDNEDEGNRRAAARVARASEIVEGSAVPSVASMLYKTSQAVILAGLAEHYCGRYRIGEVEQSISGNSFKTTLKVKRQTFKPSAADRDATAEASEETTSNTSQDGPPEQLPEVRAVNNVNQTYGGIGYRRRE